jgi:hypothetical protein
MSEPTRRKKKNDIYETYGQVLGMPNLTNSEIDECRRPIILLTQTICEHVWGQKFY